MSAEPISQREFDIYVKVTSEAIQAIQKQGQETLDVLKEYTIHNNVKHDESNKRITNLAVELQSLSEAVMANSKVTSFAMTIKKGLVIFIIAAITASGGYYGMKIVNPEKQEAKKVVVE